MLVMLVNLLGCSSLRTFLLIFMTCTFSFLASVQCFRFLCINDVFAAQQVLVAKASQTMDKLPWLCLCIM